MADSIETLLDALLVREGGYVDHPADRGGPTNYGITQKTLAAWRGHRVSAEDVRTLSEAEARAIYRRDYFGAPGLARLPAALQPFLFDCAVNHGPHQAVRFLQQVCNATGAERVAEDGRVGPATVAAAAAALDRLGPRLIASLVEQRRRFYFRLAARDPSQQVFLAGWLARADQFAPGEIA